MTSGSGRWINEGCTRKDGQKESDITRRGPHGTEPEDKAAH